jgi:diguanylate cyclase (GGDEF)-like protein
VTSPRLATAIVVALLIVTPERAIALDDPEASSRPTLLVAAGFTGTPWFYALSAVSLVGAIAAAYRLRLLRAQAREAELIRLVEERTSQLQQANDHLQRLSYIDALTSIANRRHFEEILEIEWRRGFRAQTPMTLLMLDIDNFKLYNDAFGHRAGDACLARVAKALDESVQRAGDLLARYGGEEFVAILTNTDEAGGAEVAERLRAAVEQLGIHRSDDSAQVVTISAGVATGVPGEVSSHEVLLTAADKALYEAKRAGRNRVGTAPSRILGERMIPSTESDPAV